jgi:hypothetical protein
MAWFLLPLSLGGCVFSLYQYPAIARIYDPQASYPPLKTGEIYFFLSKDAFPPGLRSVEVGTLLTPEGAQWSGKKLVLEFQGKAAEIGANAVVFDSAGINKMDYGFLYYTGHAVAYRLFRQSASEDVDLSTSQYGTQNPDLRKVGR